MDQRTTDERLLQTQKMEAIGKLAGGIAHDYNNLLTVIIGCSDLLHQQLRGDEVLQKYVMEIQTAAERAAKLTRQLLTFGQRQIVDPKILDLNLFISEREDLIKRLCTRNVDFSFENKSPLCPVRMDLAQLEQLIVNLVTNACNSMLNGGTLKISTEMLAVNDHLDAQMHEVPDGKYVRLQFADNGKGLSKEEQNRIFEPFFGEDKLDLDRGLALATCYSMVKRSAGYIAVESKTNEGTIFSIYLQAMNGDPLEESQSQSQDETTVEKDIKTILLVEDEEKLRELVETFLVGSGFKVISACNGKEGLQIVKDNGLKNVDLILTDVIMPQMSGKQMVDLLKPILPDAKIVFMSGYTDDALAPHGVLEQDIVLIEKPFLAKDLVKRIHEILSDVESA